MSKKNKGNASKSKRATTKPAGTAAKAPLIAGGVSKLKSRQGKIKPLAAAAASAKPKPKGSPAKAKWAALRKKKKQKRKDANAEQRPPVVKTFPAKLKNTQPLRAGQHEAKASGKSQSAPAALNRKAIKTTCAVPVKCAAKGKLQGNPAAKQQEDADEVAKSKKQKAQDDTQVAAVVQPASSGALDPDLAAADAHWQSKVAADVACEAQVHGQETNPKRGGGTAGAQPLPSSQQQQQHGQEASFVRSQAVAPKRIQIGRSLAGKQKQKVQAALALEPAAAAAEEQPAAKRHKLHPAVPGAIPSPSPPLEAGRVLYCFDSNVLHTDEARVAWQDIQSGRGSVVQALIPLKVVMEARAALNSHPRVRRAYALLQDMMRSYGCCRVQREDEGLRAHPRKLAHQDGDSSILDCVLYFAKLGASVVLVTEDKAFTRKALEHGIPSLHIDQLSPVLRAALTSAARNGNTGAAAPAPAEVSALQAPTAAVAEQPRGSSPLEPWSEQHSRELALLLFMPGYQRSVLGCSHPPCSRDAFAAFALRMQQPLESVLLAATQLLAAALATPRPGHMATFDPSSIFQGITAAEAAPGRQMGLEGSKVALPSDGVHCPQPQQHYHHQPQQPAVAQRWPWAFPGSVAMWRQQHQQAPLPWWDAGWQQQSTFPTGDASGPAQRPPDGVHSGGDGFAQRPGSPSPACLDTGFFAGQVLHQQVHQQDPGGWIGWHG